jgi:signal transduction histidine kinase
LKTRNAIFLLTAITALLAGFILWLWLRPPFSMIWVKATLVLISALAVMAGGFYRIYRSRVLHIRKQLYNTLQTLEAFDLDDPEHVAFEKSTIPLFNELNDYLAGLIGRIRLNYQANKQFTQNASHELQTPLAIIKGHVELLLQSPRLGEKEIETLGVILQNTNRLSRLNSALILLSKIEHNRFVDLEEVKIQEKSEEVLRNFRDLIHIQNIEIRKNFEDVIPVVMSATLAEILVANLVQNAIRHNVENGYIEIETRKGMLKITNPGPVLEVPADSLFMRFRRQSTAEESLGLGLAIVQRICDQYGFRIAYRHDKGLHVLTVNFFQSHS